VVQVVPFARAFTDAGEHRHAAMEFGDVVDELHDDDGLADPGTTERAHLAALQEGADQIDDFDTGREHLWRRRLVHERRRRAMDGIVLLRRDGSAFVHRLSGHVEHAPHHTIPDRHRDGTAAVGDP
jgi:hypothetical protein